MTDQQHIWDHLNEIFQLEEQSMNGMAGSKLHAFQRKSFEHLKQVQFPDQKNEDWRYTPVQKLIAPKYKLARHKNATPDHFKSLVDTYIIPIVNGSVYVKDLSPDILNSGISIQPLSEVIDTPAWREVFGDIIDVVPSSNRAFELLNFAFNSNGIFINVPNRLVLGKPIEFRITHDDPEISFSHPLVFIKCGSGSEIQLIERFESDGSAKLSAATSFINYISYLYLAPQAIVRHIKWQSLSPSTNLVYKLFITQKRDSLFDSFAFDYGGQLTRNNIEVELEESNTNTSLQAGFLASGQQRSDHQTRINHKAPHCESHELYKGIIDDQATAAFNGKVLVHKDAQKTNAFQQNDTLVLSKNALMNSKPQLEIFADDVKCSHGATIGQLDEKAVFYLKSRGIPPALAKHMLKKAFIAQVLDKVPNEEIRNYISSNMGLGE